MMKSGRVSTDQTFFQVGKKPKSTQFTVPDPEPEQRGEAAPPCSAAPRSRMMCGSEDEDDPGEEDHRDEPAS